MGRRTAREMQEHIVPPTPKRRFARIFDNTRNDSLATRMRRQRFAFFQKLLATLPRPLRILDVGGVGSFWERVGYVDMPGVSVVLLNLTEVPTPGPNFTAVAGDARAMTGFETGEFDVVFSNSVIEHLGTFANQRRMASEVCRVGKRIFIQTPNRRFPLEPHFLLPWFQYLPRPLQVALVQRADLGWYKRRPHYADAVTLVEEHRLLSLRELRLLFPTARIYKERVVGLTKSFVAYEGWEY